MGRAGEALAARFLESHGLRVVASNVELDRGEVDLLALDVDVRVAVEVRTSTGAIPDPIDAIDTKKRERVHRLARRVGATRVDLVGIRFGSSHVDFHWVPV